jgi:uncharacterized membrane protein
MRRMLVGVVSLLLFLTIDIAVLGQAAGPATAVTSQGPTAPAASQSPKIENPGAPKERNPPDMVCFGYYPNWSVQFTNGEARYVGFNEADKYFEGDFYWVAAENAWEWHRANGLAPLNGGYALSATIEKASCQDPVQKTTNPYSASVYLPAGDMVSGCCRKLKPGEAVIGHHGAPQSAVTQGSTMPAAAQSSRPAPSNATPAGHPVDQY